MITFLFKDFYSGSGLETVYSRIAKMMNDAIIESEFGIDEVQIRFSDVKLLRLAIHAFNSIAYLHKYKSEIIRETEINVYGENGSKTRFVFMNSIPEETDEDCYEY